MFNFFRKDKSPIEQGKEFGEEIKRTQEKLWDDFKGRGNSDEVLLEKAEALSPVVVALAKHDTKSLLQLLERDLGTKIGDDKFGKVFFEIAIFYLHFTDTKAFQYLGPERRSVFINALNPNVGVGVMEELLNIIENTIIVSDRFYYSFGGTYNERQVEYSKCKSLLPQRDGRGHFIFDDSKHWKLGEKVAEILGLEMNLQILLCISMSVLPELTLQLQELLEK